MSEITERARVVGETLAALDRTWFGATLAPGAQAQLAEVARISRLSRGETVFAEGDVCRTFGIVLTGRVALRLLVPERGNVTILTVEAGDVIGWSALVPPYRATSTAVAVEPGALLAFDGASLRERLRGDHALAASLYPRVLQAVSRRLGATRVQLLDLFAREAPQPAETSPW